MCLNFVGSLTGQAVVKHCPKPPRQKKGGWKLKGNVRYLLRRFYQHILGWSNLTCTCFYTTKWERSIQCQWSIYSLFIRPLPLIWTVGVCFVCPMILFAIFWERFGKNYSHQDLGTVRKLVESMLNLYSSRFLACRIGFRRKQHSTKNSRLVGCHLGWCGCISVQVAHEDIHEDSEPTTGNRNFKN